MSEQFGPSRADGVPDPEGTPPADLNQESARTRQIVRAVQDALVSGLGPIKDDLDRVERVAHTNFRWLLVAFGTGFLAVASMATEAYRWGHDDLLVAIDRLERRIDKLDDHIMTIDRNQAKTDQDYRILSHRHPHPPDALSIRPGGDCYLIPDLWIGGYDDKRRPFDLAMKHGLLVEFKTTDERFRGFSATDIAEAAFDTLKIL